MDTLKLLTRSSGLKVNNSQQSRGQSLPSAGGNAATGSNDHRDTNGKKRKRIEFEEAPEAVNDLDEAEIRKVQKQHKIKITDLRALHHDRSGSKSDTRKANKEAARIYPQPLRNFSQLRQLGVNRTLAANLAEQAYREPTEVQIATMPLLLSSGDEEPDLLTVAPTGSGKTLAFLVPLIAKIGRAHSTTSDDDDRHVSALIVAPTRELVSQIVNEGRKLAAGTGVRIAEMRKGMKLVDEPEAAAEASSDEEQDEHADGTESLVKVDILVATPLSLVNAISKPDSIVLPLPHIHALVLDEADYLLDPLFRDQVLSIWSACTSAQLRVSLWSATIGSSIEELATTTITSRYSKNSRKSRSLIRTVIGLKDTSLPTITHKLVYASTEPGKLMGLRQLLHPAPASTKSASSSPVLRPPFLIFTQTIPRATSLHNELKYDIPASAGGTSRIAILHSDLSSTQRAKTMTEFRQGKIWILITTDLLSRGVDFRGINGVVNYDIPTTAASYVHRAGRTGRAGREGGICVTFYTRDDIKYLKPIANLIAASEKKVTGTVQDGENSSGHGIPSWLLTALPDLSKQDRKDLKQRGVGVRRAVKESDTQEEKRRKGKNRIGTSSGYERRLEHNKKGMIEGSRRRKRRELEEDGQDSSEGGGFDGFGD